MQPHRDSPCAMTSSCVKQRCCCAPSVTLFGSDGALESDHSCIVRKPCWKQSTCQQHQPCSLVVGVQGAVWEPHRRQRTTAEQVAASSDIEPAGGGAGGGSADAAGAAKQQSVGGGVAQQPAADVAAAAAAAAAATPIAEAHAVLKGDASAMLDATAGDPLAAAAPGVLAAHGANAVRPVVLDAADPAAVIGRHPLSCRPMSNSTLL